MTAPLVPNEVDLRDFHYMPLDVVRLRDSDISVCVSAEEFRAAVMLWCAAWHQRPAASLPAEDHMLAKLAGYGRDLDAWRAAKAGALHGWILCEDGRLYHPVVAEKAVEAWEAKQAQRRRAEAAREAKRQKNAASQGQEPQGGKWSAEAASVTEIETEPNTDAEAASVTGSKGREGRGEDKKDPELTSFVRGASERAKPVVSKIRTGIADDAQPDEIQRRDADAAGLAGEDFRSEWRAFRDCHRAKGSLMLDWRAAWRTWLARRPQFQPRAGPSKPAQSAPPPNSMLAAALNLMAVDEDP